MPTKQTKTRGIFLAIIKSTPRPISLEELHKLVGRQLPNLAFSTIYRLAQQLEDEKVITRVDWRERGSRFEWAQRPHHHHIRCSVCGRTADFTDACVAFDTGKIGVETGFAFGTHHVELEGICADCQKRHK